MSTEQNKATLKRFVEEVLNKGNLALVDELALPDAVDHNLPPGLPPGPAGYKLFVGAFRQAFPDLHYHVEDVIAEGDMVAQRTLGHGTMKGDFQGMPATGKSASWSEIHIVRFANGKMVEHWGQVDQLGMLQQLGLAPTPGQN